MRSNCEKKKAALAEEKAAENYKIRLENKLTANFMSSTNFKKFTVNCMTLPTTSREIPPGSAH